MQAIPIAVSGADDSSESEGHVTKVDLPLTRRRLLTGSGVLFGTLAMGSPLALLAPSRAWAVELKTLTQAEGEALMKMGRMLYPHDKLPDAVYALLAKDLDAAASADGAVATELREGIAALNQAAGGNFAKASRQIQFKAVKSLDKQVFFERVRGKCISSIYDNDMAFAVFGYPGSAWEKGGYITRGFQDLKWLPNPSTAASPKPWFG